MSKTVKAALVQAAPIPLAFGDGIAALLDQVSDAADIGAETGRVRQDLSWRLSVVARRGAGRRDDLLDGLERVGGDADARALILATPDRQLQTGGSCIVAPDGSVIADPDADPGVLIADLDLAAIGRGLAALDSDGYYARPDVFELRIDRRARLGVADAKDGFEAP